MRPSLLFPLLFLGTLTIPTEQAISQTREGYYFLAGILAVGSIGSYVVYENVELCENTPDPSVDFSPEAQECQQRQIIKGVSLGLCLGFAYGVFWALNEASKIPPPANSNGLINISSRGKPTIGFPEIAFYNFPDYLRFNLVVLTL